MNKIFIHIEGLMVLLISTYFYAAMDASWLLFILLLFVPDLSMLGYLFNNEVGAIIYNIFHSYILPILVVLIGVTFIISFVLIIGLIWVAHIGMDRMFGYGLKYPTGFKDTHLQRL
ncbi:DUF4260 domain-containing protein [Virgibacillus byunsanensis]|uniref:DUF4260 domain-containing protein n=1 Tax=Virgibacillus byunsanensis TaxID=570945 RepID=A0ABW3LRF3_9BACI